MRVGVHYNMFVCTRHDANALYMLSKVKGSCILTDSKY